MKKKVCFNKPLTGDERDKIENTEGLRSESSMHSLVVLLKTVTRFQAKQ